MCLGRSYSSSYGSRYTNQDNRPVTATVHAASRTGTQAADYVVDADTSTVTGTRRAVGEGDNAAPATGQDVVVVEVTTNDYGEESSIQIQTVWSWGYNT